MAQDFFAAFGNDGIGQVGTETTINSGDLAGILMIAVQAAGEAHGGAKTHEGTDCGAGIAARGPRVTNESLYPNRSGGAVGVCGEVRGLAIHARPFLSWDYKLPWLFEFPILLEQTLKFALHSDV